VGKSNLDDTFFPIMNLSSGQVAVIYIEHIDINKKTALQRQNSEISKQIFPEKEYRGLSPNFHIHASVSEL
jgi:hypothetical protein